MASWPPRGAVHRRRHRVQDGSLMRRALDYARGLGVTLAQHCEDESLACGV